MAETRASVLRVSSTSTAVRHFLPRSSVSVSGMSYDECLADRRTTYAQCQTLK